MITRGRRKLTLYTVGINSGAYTSAVHCRPEVGELGDCGIADIIGYWLLGAISGLYPFGPMFPMGNGLPECVIAGCTGV